MEHFLVLAAAEFVPGQQKVSAILQINIRAR
jgi:hypothetical protein